MPINTGRVRGRRKLELESLDEVLCECERLAAAPHIKLLGNWSLGQIFFHLAAALHMSIDGSGHRPPWFIRLLGPIILKPIVLRGMSAGFQLPEPVERQIVAAAPVSTEEGLQQLRKAVRRFREESQRAPHNVFGKLTGAQWNQLHLRHSELHLSFAEDASDMA